MTMKFKVFDDFITPTYQNLIEGLFTDSNTTWSYQQHMDYGTSGAPQFLIPVLDHVFINGQTTPQIGNNLIYYTLLGLTSKIIDELVPNHFNCRTRAILQTPLSDPPKHYIPHTDYRGDHWSFIYYVNDATGDTYLFGEDVDDIKQDTPCSDDDYAKMIKYDWKPIDSVSPKKGRLIMFPSRKYHAGSSPKSDRRMLINFNFEPLNNQKY